MSGDPYTALLDVRDLRRPPNAYSILGLQDFETDEEKIDRAIRTRRSILMQRQKGTSPMVWQRLSDELDRAVDMLSDPERRAAYDEQLLIDPKGGGLHGGGNGHSKKHSASGVAASQSSTAVAPLSACPSCGVGNPSGRKFCGSCGGALIEVCVGCGAQTYVQERYCGSCGVDLEEACARRAQQAERDIMRAIKLNEEGRFQEALSIVQPVAELKVGRLAQVTRQARELVEEITDRKDQSRSRVDAAVAQALRAMDHHRWEEAVQAMKSIPVLLRRKDHQELLVQAQQALDEFLFLNQEIRAAIKSDQTLHLLPKVERILELDPGNERMKRLAEKLRTRHKYDAGRHRDRLVVEARGLLKEFEYQQACDLLEQVSPDVRNEEFTPFHDQVKELAFLWDSLRHSPTVDPVLLDLGQRLMKLSPGDPKLSPVLKELKQRSSKPKRNPVEAVPWARAPKETAAGPPIQRLSNFGKINIDKVGSNGLFVENAPRLFAACGAALQGLGHAVIETNLLPKTEAGVLGSLQSWVKRPVRFDAAWGIDLSNSGLKAIKLVRQGNDGAVAVDSFDVIEHPTLLGDVRSESQRRDVLAAALMTFVGRNAIKDEAVALVYPGRLVLGKFFQIPPIEEKRIDELMQFEARQQVPFPLDQLEWDYHLWRRAHDDPHLSRDVMLLATKRHHLVQHLALFEDANIRASAVQSDCVALFNYYQHTMAGLEPHSLVMLLDVGADATNCIVCGEGTIWFRSFPRGSDDFNKALVRRFDVSFATAEQLKHHPAKARRISNLHEAWEPVFGHLLKDIRDSLTAHEAFDSRRPIELIWACGGGFRIHGLHRYLLG